MLSEKVKNKTKSEKKSFLWNFYNFYIKKDIIKSVLLNIMYAIINKKFSIECYECNRNDLVCDHIQMWNNLYQWWFRLIVFS